MALFNHITSWFYSKNGALAVCLIKKEGIYQWVSPKFRYHGNPHGFETTLCPLKKNIKWSTGCWCNNHLEKYESQWEGLSHILWKIKNDPNHQPEYIATIAPRQCHWHSGWDIYNPQKRECSLQETIMETVFLPKNRETSDGHRATDLCQVYGFVSSRVRL